METEFKFTTVAEVLKANTELWYELVELHNVTMRLLWKQNYELKSLAAADKNKLEDRVASEMRTLRDRSAALWFELFRLKLWVDSNLTPEEKADLQQAK